MCLALLPVTRAVRCGLRMVLSLVGGVPLCPWKRRSLCWVVPCCLYLISYPFLIHPLWGILSPLREVSLGRSLSLSALFASLETSKHLIVQALSYFCLLLFWFVVALPENTLLCRPGQLQTQVLVSLPPRLWDHRHGHSTYHLLDFIWAAASSLKNYALCHLLEPTHQNPGHLRHWDCFFSSDRCLDFSVFGMLLSLHHPQLGSPGTRLVTHHSSSSQSKCWFNVSLLSWQPPSPGLFSSC